MEIHLQVSYYSLFKSDLLHYVDLFIFEHKIIRNFTALNNYYNGKKGKEKNTYNKAKHSKLIAQKKNKIKSKSEQRKARLRAIVKKANEARS